MIYKIHRYVGFQIGCVLPDASCESLFSHGAFILHVKMWILAWKSFVFKWCYLSIQMLVVSEGWNVKLWIRIKIFHSVILVNKARSNKNLSLYDGYEEIAPLWCLDFKLLTRQIFTFLSSKRSNKEHKEKNVIQNLGIHYYHHWELAIIFFQQRTNFTEASHFGQWKAGHFGQREKWPIMGSKRTRSHIKVPSPWNHLSFSGDQDHDSKIE